MRRLAVICVLALIVVTGCGSTAASCDGGCTRVLFIGNSYTAVNDLPSVVAFLGRAARHPIAVTMIAPGGETLAGHAANADTMAMVASGGWSVVVLQEQSQIPATAQWRSTMLPPARTLAGAARGVGARVVLFLTWPHRDGWPEAGLPGYARMATALTDAYVAVARDVGAEIAPVGVAWETAVRAGGLPGLWQQDGSHPTAAGTYLAACVFYATLFRERPSGLPTVDGVAADAATTLQRVAAGTVFDGTRPWASP